MTGTRGRVLVVDDELFFREAIGEILSDAGLVVTPAEDGQSALARIDEPEVGAVVLDVRLPDIDGIQVLAQVRERRPDLPVIMLSSSTDQEIVLEALRLGASDYLAKPLHDEELVLAVGRALEGHEVSAGRNRLRGRIDRFVTGMEKLSQLVRFADPGDRVSVLRQGIVDAASDVLRARRVSLMLADSQLSKLSVVAIRGADVAIEKLTSRKVGEGASGTCFAEGQLTLVTGSDSEHRFSSTTAGVYETAGFGMVPLVCLGVPVGVLCVTHGDEDGDLFLEEPNLLRLLGMQISEFLAADPDVEQILATASGVNVEGVDLLDSVPIDDDAELARLVCDAVAAETDPGRMLRRAMASVADQLSAAPVAVYLLSPDGIELALEAQADGGVAEDRERLSATAGLVGAACQSGHLIAAEVPDQDARFASEVDTASDGVVRPYYCLPLRLRDQVIGLLRVFLEPDAMVSPRTAEILAASFSAALRNVLLYRSLLQSIEEVAQARREARS